MSNNSYFGGIASGLKTLAIGMKTTMKEYFTPKSTEQYPENRKTTLHISPRFRGRLVFVRDENEAYKCVGPSVAAIRVMDTSIGRIGSNLLPNAICTGPRTCPAFGPVDITAPNVRTS